MAFNDSLFLDYVLTFIAGSYWLKVLSLLKLTKTFGPLIKIIIQMVKDMFRLLLLWVILLMFFACIATMLFSQVQEYSNMYSAFEVLF